MVMGGRHQCSDVRIATGPHLGPERIKAWRVIDGHTHYLPTEEARQILRTHFGEGACDCIGSYPRTPWHAEHRGCQSHDGTEERWAMTQRFRNESIVGGRVVSTLCLGAQVNDLNFELACLPNTLQGEELEDAQRMLTRARANVEAVIALVNAGQDEPE